MSRHNDEWLVDIIEPIAAIRSQLQRGTLSDGLVFDAVRLCLIEIGEAVERISAGVLADEPDIPWEDIAKMQNRLARRCLDTSHAIVQATVDRDLPAPEAGVERLHARGRT